MAEPGTIKKRTFADHAHDTWLERYGFKPPFTRAQYIVLQKAEKDLGKDRIEGAWNYFLSVHEEWTLGHPPELFRKHLCRWSAGGETLKVLSVNGFKLTVEGWIHQEDGRLKKIQDGKTFVIDPRSQPETFYVVTGNGFSHFSPLPPGTAQSLRRMQFKRKEARYGSR